MRQKTRLLAKAAFATALGVLSVPLAAPNEARAQIDQPIPPCNPYPSGILPANLQPELLRVRREVQTLFDRYFAEYEALIAAGLPANTGNPQHFFHPDMTQFESFADC